MIVNILNVALLNEYVLFLKHYTLTLEKVFTQN